MYAAVHVSNVCLHARVSLFVRSSWNTHAYARRSVWRRCEIWLQGCIVLLVCGSYDWASSSAVATHAVHTAHALFVKTFFFSYTIHTYKRTRLKPHTHTHTHCWIYGSFESGMLMERQPLINASFNNRPLKTGGRVIVCFSSSRAGEKWHDVEIYGEGSPVRQNY